MFHIRSSGLLHLTAESLCLFTDLSLFPHPPAPGNHFSAGCFYEFDLFIYLFGFYIWGILRYWLFLCLAYARQPVTLRHSQPNITKPNCGTPTQAGLYSHTVYRDLVVRRLHYCDCNFKAVVSVNDIPGYLQQGNGTWKCLWLQVVTASRGCWHACSLLSTFGMEGNAAFQLDFRVIRRELFSHPSSPTLGYTLMAPRPRARPGVRQTWVSVPAPQLPVRVHLCELLFLPSSQFPHL